MLSCRHRFADWIHCLQFCLLNSPRSTSGLTKSFHRRSSGGRKSDRCWCSGLDQQAETYGCCAFTGQQDNKTQLAMPRVAAFTTSINGEGPPYLLLMHHQTFAATTGRMGTHSSSTLREVINRFLPPPPSKPLPPTPPTGCWLHLTCSLYGQKNGNSAGTLHRQLT